MKNSILRQKTFAFAVKIVRLVQRLQSVHKEFILSTQILKSGTSPGANNREAEYAQSIDDFVSKLSICLKEANETEFFLELLHATNYIVDSEFKELNADCGELKALFISSIRTAKINAHKKVFPKT